MMVGKDGKRIWEVYMPLLGFVRSFDVESFHPRGELQLAPPPEGRAPRHLELRHDLPGTSVSSESL